MSFTQWTETTPSTGAVAVFNLKEMLKAAGWTVPSSSDGLTYNSSGDQITGGGSGANGMANNSAWFRVRNPSGVEYVIQRGTTNTAWRVKGSPSVGFTGGSPSATQVPSATNEGIFFGAGTDAAPTFETWFGTDGSYRHKGGADSAAPYHFWSTSFPTGGGTVAMVFVHEGLDAVEPTDGGPIHCVTHGSGGGGLTAGSLSTETESGSAARSFAPRVGVSPTAWDVYAACLLTAAATQAIPLNLPTNPITTKDESFPIAYLRRSALANPGWKGVGSMMRWLGLTRTTGDALTVTTTRDRIVMGDVSFPWQGTVPVV